LKSFEQLKQKEEQILPPPLEDLLANKLNNIIMGIILKPAPPHQAQELREKAGKLLFQISASNYDQIFSKIATNLAIGDETTSPLNLIEHINLSSSRLADLLHKVLNAVDDSSFKKTNHQILLARALTRAIWNWIDHYPMEFVSLCQNGTRLGGTDYLVIHLPILNLLCQGNPISSSTCSSAGLARTKRATSGRSKRCCSLFALI
jgi:hypothetical protein